jgi:arsenate reductase
VYFGNSLQVHWGLSDPSKVAGDEPEIEKAFLACIDEIVKRVHKLKDIAAQDLDNIQLKAALSAAGAN